MSAYGNFDVSEDTIFVTGLPEDTTETQLSEYFGQIGVIKFDKKNNCPKIWIYKDKVTGKGKGEATITYDDPPSAKSAITWFNGKEFRNSPLQIELAQRKNPPPTFNRGGGGGGGGSGGGTRHDSRGGGRQGAGPGRPGDWPCPSCSNNNFSYRNECNRCGAPKPLNLANVRPDRNHHPHQHGGQRNTGGGGYRDRDRDRDFDRDRVRDRDRDSHRGYRDRDRGDRARGDRGGRSGPHDRSGNGELRVRDRSRDGQPSGGNYPSSGGRSGRVHTLRD